jgi:hypothetical protein
MAMFNTTALQSTLCGMVTSVLVFALAGTALAQSLERLAEADANGDGNITWQEMLDMRSSIFGRLDRNGNGVVDRNDSPGFGPGKSRFDQAFDSLKDADANGDGRITRSEMLNAPAPMFEKGDTNGNRVLSASELAALREQASRAR